jgi:hypothetical protein
MKIYNVTEILSKYVDWDKIPNRFLEKACLRGSIVHAACAAYAQNLYISPLGDEYRGFFFHFVSGMKKLLRKQF